MEKNERQISAKTGTILAILIFCFSFLLFINSIGNNFVFDDRIIIEKNELLKSPSQVPQIFSTPYHYGYRGADTGLYRPVTILSFALNYYASGSSQYAYHILNIFLHSLICALLFFFVLRLTGKVALGLAASILFASHPIHTEAVSNLAGRAELLYSLFVIAALMLYGRSRASIGGKKIAYLSLSMLAFFISLLSKESAIVFPLIVIAYDFLFGKETSPGAMKRRFNFHAYLFFAGVAVAYLLIRYFVLGSLTGSPDMLPVENPLSQAALHERLLGATKVFGKYIWLLVFPLKLSADYSFNQIKMPQSVFDPSFFIPCIILAIAFYAFFRALKRSALYAFLIAFFFITYSIISNYFITIGTIMGERLMYLPSFAYCMLLSLFILSVKPQSAPTKQGIDGAAHPGWRIFTKLQIVILCMITLIYSVRTVTRNFDWKDEYSIFSSAERVSPDSVKVLNNLGAALYRMQRYDDAIERFKRALLIYPDHINARQNLAQSYLSVGDTKNAEREIRILIDKHAEYALGHFTYAEILRTDNRLPEAFMMVRKALELKPDFPEAQDLIGKMLLESGDLHGAETAFKEALERNPGSVIFHNDLGLLYTAMDRYPDAVSEFMKAVELDPASSATMSNLGIAYRGMGRYDEAIECFTKALAISPNNDSIRYNLGLTFMDQRKYELAIAEFGKITERKPHDHEALTKLGNAFLLMARYDEAINILSRAIQIDPRHEEAYALRAKAYFILRRLDDALNDYSEVIRINPQSVAARNNRGTVYAMQKKYNLARADWEDALRIAPHQKEIQLNLENLRKKQQ